MIRIHPRERLTTKYFPPNYSSQEGNPASRNLNDSAALAAKVAKKAELKQKQEEEASKAASNKPVVRKKTTAKEDAALDDLLSAGLTGKKK
jgi:hypothetical protein